VQTACGQSSMEEAAAREDAAVNTKFQVWPQRQRELETSHSTQGGKGVWEGACVMKNRGISGVLETSNVLRCWKIIV